MKIIILKNYQLTDKAFEYIYKKGRNTFDNMINDLVSQKKNLYNEGWIKSKKYKKLKRR